MDAALTHTQSPGQTEGVVTTRTFSTRRGYGPSSFGLQRRRVLLARKHVSCEHPLCLLTRKLPATMTTEESHA